MGVVRHIQFATPDDAPALAAMSRDLVEAGLGWAWTANRVAAKIRDPHCNVVVARERAEIVGFAIMRYGDDDAQLMLLAVKPLHRGRGLGAALVEWLCASARTAGIEIILAEVRETNFAGRRFYASLGFRELGVLPGYYRGVENAIRIGCDLDERSMGRARRG
jgi:ribosomal-protein-alanine N-acetyltransferase